MSAKIFSSKSSSYEAIKQTDDEEGTSISKPTVDEVNGKAAKLIDAKYGSINTTDDQIPIEQNISYKSNEEIARNETFHNPICPTVVTYELPRDILTAYILIRLENDGETNLWSKYSCCGKCGIIFALITPFTIQYIVSLSLIMRLEWKDASKITDIDSESVGYNIIALAILFIYMFRDIHGYTTNVWRFIGRVEQEQKVEYNPLHKSRIMNIGKILKRWDYHKLDPRQFDLNKHKARCLFIEFRILILAVFLLYLMLTLYSLVQIAVTDGLAEKLEVSLAIFFLLEVDDWSYDLFISQNGILEDEQFVIQFSLKEKEQENKFEKNTRNLWYSLGIVYGSLVLVMVYSFLYNPCHEYC